MTNFYYVLNANGDPEPCEDRMEWARWFETSDNARIVQKDTLGDVEVSTVFLGLDHSFGGPVPLLYETLVFGGPFDGDGERYPDREQALVGHKAWVAKVLPIHEVQSLDGGPQ